MSNLSAKTELEHLILAIKRDRESYKRRFVRFGKKEHESGVILMDTFADYVRSYLDRRVK